VKKKLGKEYFYQYRQRNIEKCRTKERLWKRKFRLLNPGRAREIDRNNRIKYSVKKSATSKLHSAILCGRIIKPNKCTRCPSTVNIQGHHPDYDKPLDVIWLCAICHKLEHKKIHQLLEEKLK
jgi:hypothetical protein